MKHMQIQIRGAVQGVNFRRLAREKAIMLGVTGFARNQADGAVYIEVEGDIDHVNRFVMWCRKGPPGVQVSGVRAVEGAVRGYETFEVR